MNEKEKELIQLIGKDAVESGIKMYKELYHFSRKDALLCLYDVSMHFNSKTN